LVQALTNEVNSWLSVNLPNNVIMFGLVLIWLWAAGPGVYASLIAAAPGPVLAS